MTYVNDREQQRILILSGLRVMREQFKALSVLGEFPQVQDELEQFGISLRELRSGISQAIKEMEASEKQTIL